MKYLFQHIVLLLVIIALFSACIREDYSPDNGTVDPNDKQVQVELFTRSYGFNTPVTRAAAQENFVGRDPWVLVFKGSTDNAVFVEAAQAYTLTGITKTFVNLTSTTDACRLLILANPRNDFYLYDGSQYNNYSTADFNTVLSGKTLSDVCSTLFTESLANPQTVVPFINESLTMSYVYNATNGISTGTKIENSDNSALGLIRTVAKMVVKNTDSNFNLHGITFIKNVPGRGLLNNLDGALWPQNIDLIDYQAGSGNIAATGDDGAGGQTTVDNPIYVYEFKTTNETYLIIEGTYNSAANPTYYKMSIIDSNKKLLDVLRNHEYTFTITNVKGPGYDTLEDALVSKSLNIDLDFEITVTDVSAYEVIANNDYFLGVSNSLFIAYFDGSSAEVGNGYYDNYETRFSAVTLVTNCKINFPDSKSISRGNDWNNDLNFLLVKPDNEIEWSNANIELPTSSTNNPVVTPVNIMMPFWMGNDQISQHILFKLGNLEKKVYVRRRPSVNAVGETITIMPNWGWSAETGWDDVDHFNSGVVDEDAKSWIKLRPKDDNDIVNYDTKVTDRISVYNGKIAIEVTENTTGLQRIGTVWLTVINSGFDIIDNMKSFRIKVTIVQKAT